MEPPPFASTASSSPVRLLCAGRCLYRVRGSTSSGQCWWPATLFLRWFALYLLLKPSSLLYCEFMALLICALHCCVPAVASEGGPYEDGIGEGDFITVTFNKPTNMISLDTDSRIRDLFNFSANIGAELSACVLVMHCALRGVPGRRLCVRVFLYTFVLCLPRTDGSLFVVATHAVYCVLCKGVTVAAVAVDAPPPHVRAGRGSRTRS